MTQIVRIAGIPVPIGSHFIFSELKSSRCGEMACPSDASVAK